MRNKRLIISENQNYFEIKVLENNKLNETICIEKKNHNSKYELLQEIKYMENLHHVKAQFKIKPFTNFIYEFKEDEYYENYSNIRLYIIEELTSKKFMYNGMKSKYNSNVLTFIENDHKQNEYQVVITYHHPRITIHQEINNILVIDPNLMYEIFEINKMLERLNTDFNMIYENLEK